MARSQYAKVLLFTPAGTNLMGGTVVGQHAEYLLIERPAAKPRASKSASPRKPRAAKKHDATLTGTNAPLQAGV